MDIKRVSLGVVWVSLGIHSLAANAETWLVDFGHSSYKTIATGYNNISSPGVQTLSNLKNSSGATTALGLSITAPFHSTLAAGTQTPGSGVGFESSATYDTLFGTQRTYQSKSSPNSQIRLTGLNTAQSYDFTFFASRMTATDNRETRYRVSGKNTRAAFLNASNNTSNVALAGGIIPASNGTITIDLAPGPQNDNEFGAFYIGAMKIVSSSPSTCEDATPSEDDALTLYPATSSLLQHYLYRPADYSKSPCKKFPLLVWLHGAGQVCSSAPITDLVQLGTWNSPGYQINERQAYADRRPFLEGLIVMPQVCEVNWRSQYIDAIIDHLVLNERIDTNRIYVTGLSLGAFGTWSYMADASTTPSDPASVPPLMPAAAVPIAGPEKALLQIDRAAHIPVWAFHNYDDNYGLPHSFGSPTSPYQCIPGSDTHRVCTTDHIDRMTPFADTRVMDEYNVDDEMASVHRTAALIKSASSSPVPQSWDWVDGETPSQASSKTLLTIYSGPADHSGWEQTYANQTMWEWLYYQSKRVPLIKIGSPTIAPATATVHSGVQFLFTAKAHLNGAQVAHCSVDLKPIGGTVTSLTYNASTGLYELRQVLPADATPGVKPIGFTVVDQNGNRTVRYQNLTLNP